MNLGLKGVGALRAQKIFVANAWSFMVACFLVSFRALLKRFFPSVFIGVGRPNFGSVVKKFPFL
jgi:hypothetical protein